MFAGLTLVAALTLLEGGVRLALRQATWQVLPTAEMRGFVTENELVYDPDLGWRPAAGLKFERLARFDPTMYARAHPGRYRAFVLGDSQALGAGLTDDQAFGAVAERILTERGLPVQVLNAAAAGFRSAQGLRLVESRLLAWAPDVLVVDFMRSDGAPMERDYGATRERVQALLFQSRLYRVLWLGVAAARGESLGPVGNVQIEAPDGPSSRGSGCHENILALARDRGIDVVFVDYPFVAHPARSLAPADRLPPGVPVVPATAALVASGETPEALFLDNNHLTARGAAVVGQALADTLDPLLRARPLP